MNSAIRSAVAGFVATVPMTIFMASFHRKLPRGERSPLPPRKITMNLAEDVGIKNKLTPREKLAMTMIGHFSYGAFAGSFFFPFLKTFKVPKYVGGISYGLLVWLGSYQGLLPMIKLHPPASQMTPKRNLLMIVAHIVWGTTLGALYNSREEKRLS